MLPLWMHELTKWAQKGEKLEILKKSKGKNPSSIFSKKMSKLVLAFLFTFTILFFALSKKKQVTEHEDLFIYVNFAIFPYKRMRLWLNSEIGFFARFQP